jgi:hypothetical protein
VTGLFVAALLVAQAGQPRVSVERSQGWAMRAR